MILAATALIMSLSMMVATLVSIHNQASREHDTAPNSYSDWQR